MEQKTTIRFMSNVDEQSIRALVNAIEGELQAGIKLFRILISSPGGYVDPGISAFNYLKGIPAEIETVNFGSVDSIAAVLFCAGSKRMSVPNARFIIHDIFRITPQQSINLSEIQLEEWLNSLRIDRKNIAKIIADICQKRLDVIEDLMRKGAVLNSVEAQKIGLVNDINQNILEENARIITLG